MAENHCWLNTTLTFFHLKNVTRSLELSENGESKAVLFQNLKDYSRTGGVMSDGWKRTKESHLMNYSRLLRLKKNTTRCQNCLKDSTKNTPAWPRHQTIW